MDTKQIVIKKVDDVYMHIQCDADIAYELRDHFAFMTPNARFDPRVQNKYWDGKLRLFNITKRALYVGLLVQLIEFCDNRDYEYIIDPALLPDVIPPFSFEKFWKAVKIPDNFEQRDYQIDAFTHAIENQRAVLLSPTGSGKSLIIYLLSQFYLNVKKLRTLLVVDSISLVHQMHDDIYDYGYTGKINRIYQGQEKQTDAEITITTWQSIYGLPANWYNQFGVIIGDEAHKFKADCLGKILRNCKNIKYRFGTTGTLDEVQCHEMVLVGLFGPIKKVITTRELIDQGTLANLKIECIDLKYDKKTINLVKRTKKKYHEEVDFIITREKRNKFLLDLCDSIPGNKLILFQFVQKHGKPLFKLFDEHASDPTFFIAGEIDGLTRNQIRKDVNNHTGSNLIASYGTCQTGINIVNINHVILSSPSKSKIRVLQSIGRGLRKGEIKHDITVWDIIDNLKDGAYSNHILKHFYARLEIYNKELFDYNIRHVKIII